MSDNPEISVSPDPTAAEPSAADPKAAEPSAAEPSLIEPSTAEPTAANPTAPLPTAANRTAPLPASAAPASVDPSLIEPSAAEPTAANPTAPLPTAANRTAPLPTAADSASAAPASVDPTAAAPASAAPASVDPTAVDPASAAPASADPTAAAPASADPTASADPASADPTAVTPASADPASVDPASVTPAPVDPTAPAPKRPRNRRRVAVLAATGVLVGAVLAGGGYTVVTVRDAERDPGSPSWSLPKAPKEAKAAAATGLRGMLLPYDGDTYLRGPDMAEFGSDVALSGRQATLLRKESVKDLPRSQRRELERQIDRNPVKGMAMRSYVSTDVTPGDQFTMEFVLAQMGNARAVRSIAGVQKEFFDALKVFRKGPEIEGFKDSTACFLPPADSDEKLDMMFCSGYVGDVLVTATATAAKPLDKKGAAEMLRAQLDRIKEPGAAV
ncbi:hypothetical protein ACFZDK_25145 [Streptomyces sp. NPDC007901]|uniref:hypothetical protein n=1 Tax=Streptomyces sp. NPDC007901 TaxID=3364785 RepID=UPI0036EC4250